MIMMSMNLKIYDYNFLTVKICFITCPWNWTSELYKKDYRPQLVCLKL